MSIRGGDPALETDTIGDSLSNFVTNRCHSYVCGWSEDGKAAPDNLQSTMRWLFSSVGYNIESVYTSNLLFVRGRRADEGEPMWTTEKLYWRRAHAGLLSTSRSTQKSFWSSNELHSSTFVSDFHPRHSHSNHMVTRSRFRA